MRICLYALIMFIVINAGIDNAFSQVDMCSSVQEHIKKAERMGGEKMVRLKITQIFEARKYLSKSISEPELVRCVLLSGFKPDYIISEAVKAGIPKQTVQVAYVQYNMSLPPDKRAPLSLVSPLEEEEAPSEQVEEAEDFAEVDPGDELTTIIAKDSSEGGVETGPGCNQISPWTWCAY